jgi:hypothetical protein
MESMTFRDRFRRALRRKAERTTGPDTKPEPGLIARGAFDHAGR